MSSEDEGHPCGAFGVVCGHLCAMFCFETCCACVVPSDVPFRPHDLSVVFLDYVLKRPSGKDNKPVLTDDQSVVSVEAKGFGTGDGLLSQMYRLKLTYSPSGAGPATIVAKLSPPNAKARLTGSILSLFKYEHEFYTRGVAHKIGLNIPRCYYSGLGDYGRYCILLEDFAPASPADQLKGLSKSEVAQTISQISKLHAKYRGCVDKKEELSWVLKQDNDFYYSIVVRELKKKAQKVEQLMSNELKLGQEQYQHMLNVVQWLDEHGDLYKRFVTHNLRRIDKNWYPSTLTHGDVRGENILFPQEHRKDFMLFDFQLMKEVNGVTDIGYLLVSSMTVKERRVHEENLLVQYMNEMKKRGAADLTWEEIFVSYALAHTVTCIITAFAVVDNISGEGKHDPKTRKTALEYVLRSDAAVKDWNVMSLLKLLPKKVHDDNTLDKFTLEEIMPILPSQKFRDLLKAESGSEFLKGDSQSVFSVTSVDSTGVDTKKDDEKEEAVSTKADDVAVETKE